jgi:sterol desaturase/sphingolipid hydroxylase (fatty acid hydroxylase superfamily)
MLSGWLTMGAIVWFDRLLDLTLLREWFYLGAMAGTGFWIQFAVLLFVSDFAKWAIHVLLHKVPALWEFHKVHHSIEELDWIGNWRFHWMEVFVYRMLLYPVAAFFGFSGEAMFWCGVLSTFFGHFAHANVRVKLGRLAYFFNGPEMHAWHHTHPEAGPVDRNFGMMFSVWDWLFGTAHLPSEAPARLGFAGVEAYPRGILRQWLAPFVRGYDR